MIKKFSLLGTIVLIIIAMSGCGMNTLEKYKTAFEKTSSLKSYQEKTEIELGIDLSNLSEKQKKDFENFSEININSQKKAGSDGNKEIDVYFKTQKLDGVDGKIYNIGDEVFFKTSIIPKLVKVNKDSIKGTELAQKNYNLSIDKEKMEKIAVKLNAIWKESIKDQIIANEGNEIVPTPDGDIKVTKLILELTDERAKKIMQDFFNSISNDPEMLDFFISTAQAGIDANKSIDGKAKTEIKKMFKELSQNFEKWKENFEIDKLKITAKIDKDYHIIQDDIENELTIRVPEQIKVKFKASTTLWDINKPLTVTLPESKENAITVKEFLDLLKKQGIEIK